MDDAALTRTVSIELEILGFDAGLHRLPLSSVEEFTCRDGWLDVTRVTNPDRKTMPIAAITVSYPVLHAEIKEWGGRLE